MTFSQWEMVTKRDQERERLPSLVPLLFLAQLKTLCQELHKQLQSHEESRYDLEFKIRKQDYDVSLPYSLSSAPSIFASRSMN